MSSDRLQTGIWLALGAAVLWLLYMLSPILTPFILAAVLAYICDPLVERLCAWRWPRPLAAMVLIVALGFLLFGLLLIVLPLLQEELMLLVESIPDAIALANESLVPWLREHFGLRISLDPASIRKWLNANAGSLQSVGVHVLSSLRIGGMMVLGLLTTLMLTPVVLFYLLVDWPRIKNRLEGAIPRPWHAKTMKLVRDVDAVLSEFLRGQLLVMLALAVYYSAALAIAGIPSALPVGILTGLLVFIPYIGFGLGFLLALLVATLQFQGINPILIVLAIYGVGQLIEGFLLTPYLVGDRIGLHPLAVLFALLAFGQLFGFVGVLIALPVSAALLIGLREVRALYLSSRFYRGASDA